MEFQVIGSIRDTVTIAVGRHIRELPRLRRAYGKARCRKMKGQATVKRRDGTVRPAEVHWYEAHGVGRRELKLKLPSLDEVR